MIQKRQTSLRGLADTAVKALRPLVVLAVLAGAVGCSTHELSPFVSAISGAACEPHPETYMPMPGAVDRFIDATGQYCVRPVGTPRSGGYSGGGTSTSGSSGGVTDGTTAGSGSSTAGGGSSSEGGSTTVGGGDTTTDGKLDCINKPNGLKWFEKPGCRAQDFPQPGCDATACCDATVVVVPPAPPEAAPTPVPAPTTPAPTTPAPAPGSSRNDG